MAATVLDKSRDATRRPTRLPGPTVEQARAFCAVADSATYKAAAAILGMDDHTAVIRLVSRFSKALGHGPLVEANSRGEVTLTAAGHEVLETARRFHESAEALTRIRPDLRFAAYPTIVERVVEECPTLLERSVDADDGGFPVVVEGIDDSARSDGGWGLAHAVADGRLDIAIAPAGLSLDGLESHPLYDWRLRALLPSDSPLADRQTVTPADLQGLRVAAAPPGCDSRELLSMAFRQASVELRVALESPDQAMLRSVARHSGDYVAILPDDTLGRRDLDSAPILRTDAQPEFGGSYALYVRSRNGRDGHEPLARDVAIAETARLLREQLPMKFRR